MKTFYLRDDGRNPVACVVYERLDNKIRFGVSSWNKKDPFSRKIAREVAYGRLNKQELLSSGPKFRDAVKSVCSAIISGQVSTSERAKKSAKTWLSQVNTVK
jgi:hypothetical protein